MIRVGVDECIADELLRDFPREVELVKLPRQPKETIEIDFWILPLHRKYAEEMFSGLREVKVAQCLTAGVDWVTPWLPKEITLCDGRGVHDISASEWVVAAILASMKRFPFYRDLQSKQQWRADPEAFDPFLDDGGDHAGHYQLLGEDLEGKTVLIVGYGSIGAAIEARLRPFDVKVLRIARSEREEPKVYPSSELHRMLPEADVVVVIVPLTAETEGMFGTAELGLMKRGALLVNAARGPVVVTDALVVALTEQRIRAALDVTDPEPLPAGHPLWSAPNCILTPHVAGSTPQFIRRAFRFSAEQIRRYTAGKPLANMVTKAGY